MVVPPIFSCGTFVMVIRMLSDSADGGDPYNQLWDICYGDKDVICFLIQLMVVPPIISCGTFVMVIRMLSVF